jgi:TPR repeat protein
MLCTSFWRMAALGGVLTASIAVEPAAGQEAPPLHRCDELAANPLDPARKAAGVANDDVKGEPALAACTQALAAYPEEPRFQFQIARAYRALNRNEEAVLWYRKAADQGHASAQNSLGVMYMSGLGVKSDCAEAVRWYAKAAAQGFEAARRNLDSAPCMGRAELRQIDLPA